MKNFVNLFMFMLVLPLVIFSCEGSESEEPIMLEEPQSIEKSNGEIKKGLYGDDAVNPGDTRTYTAQFFDGGNEPLGDNFTILWIMQGSGHQQKPFDHYTDCEMNGDCV